MKLVSLAEAESSLSALLDAAKNERVVVEREGYPLGVILSVADYQDWSGMTDAELTELFSQTELQAKLTQADGDFAAGRTLSHEEVGRRLRQRIEDNG